MLRYSIRESDFDYTFNFDYIFNYIMSFIHSYVFTVLISIISFQLKECPLAFLVRQVWWWLMNTLSFCLFGESISSSLLKDSFARYSILGWQSFFLQRFDMSSHSFVAYKVSAEKSSKKFMGLWQGTFSLLLSKFSLPLPLTI